MFSRLDLSSQRVEVPYNEAHNQAAESKKGTQRKEDGYLNSYI